ncbi:MAG: ATP-dependent helicase RhlE [Blastocatellia bacterium]|jgi:ATP-dependent RNA helicase RhlE|nr:ATP-dependent helicase RhlE [Blastocatellia bacterium]
MNFSELGLAPAQVRSCESLGYTEPTPIQEQAIPVVLRGEDLIGCAETGTGKTAAFLLPIIQRITTSGEKGGTKAPARPGVRVLVLAPTRELATQIEKNYRELNPAKQNRSVTLIGGANIRTQITDLHRRPAVLIATPGRLLDLTERGAVDLSTVEVLVLDEADRMLDMGFLPAIRRVLSMVPAKRQTLLFSATMSSEIEKLARTTMRAPKFIEVSTRGQAPTLVKQTAYPVAQESKTALLLDLLERERFERVLVFTRTRRGAERLSHILEARDHSVNRIHADRTQPQREAALRGFRDGRTRVLVATDIAARGIDVDAVSHVINYDVPAAPEDYVHRIGRTGRAGNQGRAITIVTPVDELSMRAIERLTGQPVERVVLPGFGGTRSINTAPKKPFNQFRRSSSSVRSFRPRRASR